MSGPDERTQDAPLIDVRPQPEFLAGHVPGSVGIPLEELPSRTHELPPASGPVRVTDSDAARANEAAEFLRRRGHDVAVASWSPAQAIEFGATDVRLWKPNPFLVEALDRIEAKGEKPGIALDVACGSGRDAVYLALRGYEVDAVDVLPDALRRAEDLSRRCGVAIRTHVRNLERDAHLPPGSYDLITVFRYLQRSLFAVLRQAIRPGGFVAYETFHERNRLTGRKPCSPDHLLETGELARAFEGFEVLICRDAQERDGRFFSSILARRVT